MKKLLLILLCLPLLFSSCQEDDPTSSSAPPSSSASVCGNGTVIVDVTNYTLTSPSTMPNGDCLLQTNVIKTGGILSGVTITLTNISPIWTVSAMLITPFTETGTPINLNQTYFANNSVSATTYIGNMIFNGQLTNINGGLQNGEITITNIDYSNETIDGEFSFTGYPIAGGPSQQVASIFSNIPFFQTELP
ncbi:hypothetical protein OAK24_01260 [Flavobacteriales bacterium]|nr:hypothetical protein [Flavobacteriales bacterium]